MIVFSYVSLLQVAVTLLLQMVLTLYHCPASFPSRTALMVARAVGVELIVINLDLFEKEQINPEFVEVS